MHWPPNSSVIDEFFKKISKTSLTFKLPFKVHVKVAKSFKVKFRQFNPRYAMNTKNDSDNAKQVLQNEDLVKLIRNKIKAFI
ncbi:MAG: hypothetical protein LBB15_02940 [Puniceicoccales bacterium]|nr:hypothetical protein [Puniceicoccales bacterium]